MMAEAKKTTKKKVAAEEVEATPVVKEKKAKKATKATSKTTKKVSKKETKKEVKVEKHTVTEAKASALNVKVTPRKARYVIDTVRGKNCNEAIALLGTIRQKAAPMVAKVIASAVANATNNFGMNGDKLYIASIQASDSVKMKRYLPRAKGSASGLVKRFSNIYVTVKERM